MIISNILYLILYLWNPNSSLKLGFACKNGEVAIDELRVDLESQESIMKEIEDAKKEN